MTKLELTQLLAPIPDDVEVVIRAANVCLGGNTDEPLTEVEPHDTYVALIADNHLC